MYYLWRSPDCRIIGRNFGITNIFALKYLTVLISGVMEINKSEKSERELIYPVDIEEILTLCSMECGYRLMN